MGDQDEISQQTRVLVINGQTIILQGDVSESSMNEILEQALQEATISTDNEENQNAVSEEQHHEHLPTRTSVTSSSMHTVPETQQTESNMGVNDDNNFVAIFENEHGETQTVQLTLEQAAALGFQVTSDADASEKEEINTVMQSASKETNQDYTHSSLSRIDTQPVATVKNDQPASTVATTTKTLVHEIKPQAQNSPILGTLLKPAARSVVTLSTQYVSKPSPMTYSVKLQEPMVLSPSNVQISDILLPAPQATVTSSHTLAPQPSISMTQPGSSVLNQQKISMNLPVANKNLCINRQPIVRLKPPVINTTSSAAIIRPATTKTVIPKIQGTPTSMANLAMTSALPISSTASMVRVLNSSTSTSKTTNVKPTTSTATCAPTPLKILENSSLPLGANVSKPLGSSENPIQLVQHGQTFHSMQPLSQEQLKQIATVLQQKQLDTSRNSKNVLYDATTNTRIIYRVVYPEDLALRKPTPSISMSTSSSMRGTGRGGRKGRPPKGMSKTVYTKKLNSDEDDDQLLDPDLSKGEKEERKKVIPRTRSGRLSRPPRHMVKDYKRIHHLDFAEPDLDDSDGGYSDYRISDSEPVPDAALEDLPGDTPIQDNQDTTIKRAVHSKFRCPTCQKMYLGYRRLARHFETNPDHGSMDDIPKAPPPAPTLTLVPAVTIGSSAGQQQEVTNGAAGAVPRPPGVGVGRGRGRRRGNHFLLSPGERSERRKTKLREFLVGYEPGEVAEVAGPMVAQSLDLWQLLLLRVGACEDQPTRLAALFSELRPLLDKARSRVTEILAPPVHLPTEHSSKTHRLEITDSVVASALNISCGKYNILDSDDRKLQWRPSSLGSMVSVQAAAEGLVTHHSVAQTSAEPVAKKSRMWNLEPENIKLDETQTDKTYLDSTNESEKPSDTSMSSDTPLDDIVKAELKNLANKSGLDDFVAPPAPPPSSSLSHAPVVDFVAAAFPSSEQGADSHFPADLVMDMPSTTDSDTTGHMQASDPSSSSSSLSSKHQSENMHFQIASSTRLDLSGSSIDVNLDSQMEESTQELDFEALSEEFNRNTQS